MIIHEAISLVPGSTNVTLPDVAEKPIKTTEEIKPKMREAGFFGTYQGSFGWTG